MKIFGCIVTERDGIEYYWEVIGHFSQYIPAKTNGRPEDCYPEEGGELEEVLLKLTYVDPGDGVEEPLYYHYCHPEVPHEDLVEAELWAAYEKATK